MCVCVCVCADMCFRVCVCQSTCLLYIMLQLLYHQILILIYHFCRGSAFRVAYSRLGDLRCLLPTDVHVLALTATVTQYSYAVIRSSLGMLQPHDVIESPNKDNIYYHVMKKLTVQELVSKLSEGIRKERLKFPKTVLFCRRYV